jgi:hypothetical protein
MPHNPFFSFTEKNYNFRPLDCVQLNIINADMIHQEINKTNENEMYYKPRELRNATRLRKETFSVK